MFREPNLFTSSCEGRETSTLLGSNFSHWTTDSKELTGVGVSLPSPEDGNRSSFRNVVFNSYLEFRTMYKT
jgi:hypothetical protein